MRIVNWNIEWMNHWISGNDRPVWGSNSLSVADARQVAERVARVIRTLDPDLICIQEGPSSPEEMNLFLDDLLSENGQRLYRGLIGADGGQQKLYVLAKENGAVDAMDYATDALTQALRDDWDADVNGDLYLEPYDFTRQPLVVDVDPRGGQPFRVVVLHTKSKYVHRGRALWQDPARRQEFVALAMQARRRISAEGFRLRTYLDDLLKDDGEARVVVTGDFNDGPGQDLFERSYLTHNVTDILLGSTFYPRLIFHHPLVERVSPASLFTARFDDYVDEIADRPLLLDHFVVSPAMVPEVADAGIAHAAYENEIAGDGSARVDRPSDHRPVFVDLQ